MKLMLAALTVVSLLCGAGIWMWRDRLFHGESPIALGKADVPFSILANYKTIEGQSLEIESWKGKTIVLNFWASWCPPCLQEMPSLLKLVDRHKETALLVAVSADDTLTQLKKFLTLFPLSKSPIMIVVHDSTREIMRNYGIVKLPETIIFDRQHNKLVQLSGSTNFDDPSLEKFFE